MAAALIASVIAFDAKGCECVFLGTIMSSVRTGQEVFLGRVIEDLSQQGANIYRVKVLRRFSGSAHGESVIVFTGFGGASCGIVLRVGDDFVIDGSADGIGQEDLPQIRTGLCTFTAAVNGPRARPGEGPASLRRLRWFSWWYRLPFMRRRPPVVPGL
jgi:hypothetical protein